MLSNDIRGRGGHRPDESQKIEKSSFFKSCDTLTTIQVRQKLQLRKVVKFRKRFVHHLRRLHENRDFHLKNEPRSPYEVVGGGSVDDSFLQ